MNIISAPTTQKWYKSHCHYRKHVNWLYRKKIRLLGLWKM